MGALCKCIPYFVSAMGPHDVCSYFFSSLHRTAHANAESVHRTCYMMYFICIVSHNTHEIVAMCRICVLEWKRIELAKFIIYSCWHHCHNVTYGIRNDLTRAHQMNVWSHQPWTFIIADIVASRIYLFKSKTMSIYLSVKNWLLLFALPSMQMNHLMLRFP